MTFAHPLPWWALVALSVAACGLAAAAYNGAPLSGRRRLALIVLRSGTLLLIVVFLMRPVAPGPTNDPADAVVPILVDTSRSMNIEDAGGLRRIDRARQIVSGELLPALSSRFRTEVLAFGESLSPVEPERLMASGRRSDLAGALQAVRNRYLGRTVAGIVLVSDGGDTSGTGEAAVEESDPPLFPLGVGSRSISRDREVLSVTAVEAVLDDSVIDLAVSAVGHGLGTDPIELRLLENGRPIDLRRVRPAEDGTPVQAVFQVAPPAGSPAVYTVDIPPAAGELVPENNSRSVLVQPRSRPRRVLLVQGAPGFEHNFLRRAWSGDPGLELDSVARQGKNDQGSDTFYVQAAASRSAALAAGFPQKAEDLFAYDALVLANLDGSLLTREQLQSTREFVGRRGGGLLVLGAHSFLRRGLIDTPLEELLALDIADRGRGVLPASARPLPGANRVALTPAGEAHPVMQLGPTLEETRQRWEAVPALASIVPLGGPRPGGTVLAVASGPGGIPRPLIAVQRYGEGRSMVFAGEAAWRWRMLLPAADRSYATFWRQAIRWLALPASDPIALVVPAGAAPGEALDVRVAARDLRFEPLRDTAVEVRVARPDGRVESVPAAVSTAAGTEGMFVARYRADAPGVYRITADVRQAGAPLRTAATSMLVGGADPEMTDPRLNLRLLQRLALVTGGRLVEGGDMGALAANLHDALPAATLRARRDLWHNAWSFAAVVMLLGAEWVLRRRWGLR